MTEYTIKAKETTSGIFYVRANSEEEAMKKFAELTMDGGYRDMMEDVESFTTEIISHTVINGKELEQGYIKEMDSTVIVEYTYQNAELVGEQIVGYYHGEPYEDGIKEYAYKGTYINYAIFK